jgi:AraC-like DNA-binding protein
MTCTVCAHPARGDIESQLVNRDSLRDIARQHNLSKDALARHKADHLPAVMVKSAQAREIAHADHLLEEANRLYQVATDIMEETRKNKPDTALRAIQAGGRLLELLGELLGELNRSPQVNILVAPEWLAVRSVLLQALAPYPEARAATAAALLQMEASRGDG